ncbi:tRNA (adenosine(37)-N6)-threonylcarbamoyltransferase complex dimerization subunit type 1 TsaB [Streptomyces sp. NBC_01795]|uniref:tRNA (adenosine(37)-N6)-threonylcarbamoyltransferase complex dimerization subunit type 1 TsaB n=1 Tax=Streptomyces sp. NBC_01795 TaxID=2975943 RepID=UPI002DDB6448|nr:tRNA (adenosine(37)-N6)-threonylcarbamoyltransferase complex dimerization subunit type 1 TsaB [Streptomyces sp. NBC_01795]WSA92931.1 tRNA (adenosine(37)-N6)-threonylcarbamoyltransferase complex dimerization subunit type 1 TsaB [Streptomyces sp. NBC_01795]
MLMLALDTATPAVTVALHDADGDRTLAAAHQVDARRHGELLLPSVDRVLSEAGRKLADVTDVVVGVGPGPYTGLRVGLATAEAFGAALGLRVHGVCTLDGIAYGSGLDEPFVVATDARRKEVYWARYADARTRVGEPAVDRPAELAGSGARIGVEIAGLPSVGAGAVLYEDVFRGVRHDLPADLSARALARLAAERLARGEELLPPHPLYLRRPDAQVPANYKVVTPR